MALTLSSTISFVQIAGYPATGNLTTASVSLPANSLVVIVGGHYGALTDYGYTGTPTNTGTALTWNYSSGALNNDGTNYNSVAFFWAKNTSAQTVTITSNFVSFADFPVFSAIAGYVFTGHNTTTPIGAVGGGNTGTITTTAADSYVVSGIIDAGATTYTSSNMTYQTIANSSGDGFAAYASRPTAGSFTASYASGPFTVPAYEIIEILAAGGGTAHTASGTSTITATGTGTMRNARVGAGTGTGTATGTGAASRGQSVTGSASVTASATAAMSSTQVIGASGTGTATGTASASVAGVVTISGSATITGTGTSTASVAMAQTATATGTVIATSSVDFIVIPPITLQSNGTVIADSSGEMAKTMPIESTGTATAASQADATHTYYIFKPPTREISPLSLDPYYELVGYFQGRTLVKRDGVWKLVQNRQEDWLDQCEYVFKGGCENRVTGAEKAELESAGYTVETRTS